MGCCQRPVFRAWSAGVERAEVADRLAGDQAVRIGGADVVAGWLQSTCTGAGAADVRPGAW